MVKRISPFLGGTGVDNTNYIEVDASNNNVVINSGFTVSSGGNTSQGGTANVGTLEATTLQATTANVTTANVTTFTASSANVTTFTATTANVATLEAPTALVGALQATSFNVAGMVLQQGHEICPIGTIQMYGATAAPAGWLKCDGTAVSRSTYSGLYSVLGDAYGPGDGSTTFDLPNLATRFPTGNTGAFHMGMTSDATLAKSSNTVATLTTTAEGAHVHTPFANVSASQGAKDSTTIEVMQDIATEPDHTHTVDVPFTVVNFIIKH